MSGCQLLDTNEACAIQVKELGYTPIVVLSQADRECEECRSDSLQEYPKLTALKDKVNGVLAVHYIIACKQYMLL